MKQCSKCHETKEINQYHKDKKAKDGLFAFCKKCSYETTFDWRKRNPQKVIENRHRYYIVHKKFLVEQKKIRKNLNPEQYKIQNKIWARKSLLKKYGLTLQSFEEKLKKQSRRCAICEKLFKKRINIDHNHKTGKVRGLLCTECNISLGHIEKKGFLEKANKYLILYIKNC